MARTEVYINGKLADFNEIDLSFVYSVEDDDTLSVSGSHSKRSIKLPATKRNNDIFSNAILLQQPQNLNAGLLSLPARIIVDGIPVFIGTAQIDKAGITKLSSYYEVLFLSDNSNWIEQMRDVGMDTIEMHDVRPIDYTGQNVVFFYSAYNNLDGFCFFLPKTAKWRRTGSVRTDEFYPAIFIDYIFRKAFSNLGYTIKSDFFDTELWRGLIVPVLQRNYDTKWFKQRSLVQMGTAVNVAFGNNLSPIRFNNIVNPLANQVVNELYPAPYNAHVGTKFKPKVNGKYKFTGYYISDQRPPNTKEFFGIYVNRVGVPYGTLIKQETLIIDLVIGDVVEFYLEYLFPGTTPVNISYSTLQIEYVGLVSTSNVPNVTIGNYFPHNAFYELNQLCSKWKILDIISDIQKVFNLIFVTDTSKKEVTIEPRDYWQAIAAGANWNGNGFYTENQDITRLVDVSKEIEQEYNPDAERYIVLNYNNDDPTVKYLEENREEVKLYSHKFDRGQRFANEEKETKLSFFNKCMHIIDSEINPNTTDPKHFYQLPLLFSANWYTNKNPDFPDYDNDRPYLLWFYGNYAEPTNPNEGATGIDIFDPITLFRQRKGFPLAWMVMYDDYNVYSDYMANLSFSKEGYTHSLITSFHQRNLERLAQNVKVKTYLNWSNIDIFQLDFRKKYVINGVQMLLKTIDGYNPATKTTTKTVFQVDTRLLKDGNNTNTEGIDSDLKGLIVI